MEFAGNTFNNGVNTDLSDFVIRENLARGMKNMRLIDLDGNRFVVTNIKGTEEAFSLTAGFKPVAAAEFNNILYLVSFNKSTNEVEIGSYPSPDYSGGTDYNKYRPFSNLDDGPFRTDEFGLEDGKPVDIEIQPDYDDSVNVILMSAGIKPRLVNSKFSSSTDGAGNRTYTITDDRAGDVNSNDYTTSSVEEETRLILNSGLVLKIDYGSIESGGTLKPGNYTYIFRYMTEDFNPTDVIGQSSIYSVFKGNTYETVEGGTDNDVTSKLVNIDLSNLDTDFAYLKVYALYNGGNIGRTEQLLEFTEPIEITGTSMTFTHTGYEETNEVSLDTINIDYSSIEGASTCAQIEGYLLAGGIKETSYDYTEIRNAISNVTATHKIKTLPKSDNNGYVDPKNIHDYLGYMGGETYPFGMCLIFPDGTVSPAFPVKGKDFTNSTDLPRGLIRMKHSNVEKILDDNNLRVKHLEFDISSIPQSIRDQSIGFFFVRGNRRPDLISQGYAFPTLRVPPISYYKLKEYYYETYPDETVTSRYRFVPLIDSIIDAWEIDVVGGNEVHVVNELNEPQGYLPIFINDTNGFNPSAIDLFSKKHWAFFSGDAFVNEAYYVTRLNQGNLAGMQIALGAFRVKGEIPESEVRYDYKGGATTNPSIGMHYDLEKFDKLYSVPIKTIAKLDYISGERFATGSQFISKFENGFYYNSPSDNDRRFDVSAAYNPYFGIEFDNDLADSGRGIDKPIGGNFRVGSNLHTNDDFRAQTSGVAYDNLNTLVNAGFLMNIYPNGGPTSSPENLYPSISNLPYRQVSPRYAWSDVTNDKVQVFGGDCYIARISRKVYQSGLRNPLEPLDRKNINSGQVVTFYQESPHNLHLRHENLFDTSELEKRSFHPYKGDIEAMRLYRYPETGSYSRGYSEHLAPKGYYGIPENTPVIKSQYYTRIMHSSRTVPNAFRNGYRSFTGLNFQDYDSSMGKIVRMFNHRNTLLVVFESGIGVTEINQRIQTGSDAAGAIFVEPNRVLPPNMQFYSRDIGAQDFYAMVQTPAAVYGIDRNKQKIWQITDKLTPISDFGYAQFMKNTTILNPRVGYDIEYNEVLFTTDLWTIAFKEGMNKFNGLYSMNPTFYARKGKDFFSFTDRFHIHNAENNTVIYGNKKESYVEFVVNKDVNITKVFDYLNIISNEVKPSKIEFFTYNESVKEDTLNTGNMNQYAKVEDEKDFFTDKENIYYRDKKFVIAIPKAEIYNVKDINDEWGVDSRLRNKYLIVRITYDTDEALELVSTITSYRYSKS